MKVDWDEDYLADEKLGVREVGVIELGIGEFDVDELDVIGLVIGELGGVGEFGVAGSSDVASWFK